MNRLLAAILLPIALFGVTSCGGDGGGPVGPVEPVVPTPAPVASVTLSRATLSLIAGEAQQLTATLKDQSGNVLVGRAITWESTDLTVASVSDAGMVTALRAGTATVRATSEGRTGSALVTVTAAVASVSVTPGTITLLVGEAQQLIATVYDSSGNVLQGRSPIWTSDDSTVASVSASGLVTGRGAGSATIRASLAGKTGTADASVSFAIVSFSSVVSGGAHTCGLTDTGAAWCWGRGESGQLGIAAPGALCLENQFSCSLVPRAVAGGLVFAQLTAGGAHTCGLTTDGSAHCWGNNAAGQLGDNTTSARSAPAAVATALKFSSIDAGAEHTCGVTSEGAAHCWGRNNRGQLGDASTTNRSVPVAVTGGLLFDLLDAGGFVPSGGISAGHTCGLTTAGKAYCWGANDSGQLGTGGADQNAYTSPAAVTGGLTFTTLSVGLGQHTCGITAAGAAYCWGANPFGALGNGTTTSSAEPVPVSGGHTFDVLTAGGFVGHTCALTPAGLAYCWGDNEAGQVGDGTSADRLQPAAVSGGHVFLGLSAGYRHNCGRASTGVIQCWGSNGAGQLGLNSTSNSTVPTRVVGQP